MRKSWFSFQKPSFLLFLILILGTLLRGLEVFSGNYLFLYDQGLYYLEVKEMIERELPRLIGTATPIPGVFQAPYFYYLLLIFYLLFRGDPYGGVVFAFITGMLVIVIVYFLVRRLFGERTALLASFLIAVSPSAVSASRLLWPPYLIYLLMPFYLFFLIKALWGEKKYLPFTFLFASLIFSFEIPAGLFLFLPIVSYLLIWRRELITKKNVFVSFLLTSLPPLPLLIFNFRHENIIVKGIIGVLQKKYSAGTPLESFPAVFVEHLKSFRDNLTSVLPINFPYFWFLLIFFTLVLIWYLWVINNSFDKREKLFILICSSLPFLIFVQFMFYKYVVWGWYLIPLNTVYIFLFAFLGNKIFLRKKLKFLAALIVVLLLIKALQQINFIYTQEIHDEGGAAKIKGKIEAIDYIYKDAGGEKFNVLVFMPPVYTYPYDYLFEWYGKKKFGYIPGKKKQGLFYLLIEPDPTKPWSYKGWQETMIKVGEVLKTEKLPSGLIVEKRYYEVNK